MDFFDKHRSGFLFAAAVISGFLSATMIYHFMPGFLHPLLRGAVGAILGFLISVAYIKNERRKEPKLFNKMVYRTTTVVGAMMLTYAGLYELLIKFNVHNMLQGNLTNLLSKSNDLYNNSVVTATNRAINEAGQAVLANNTANPVSFFAYIGELSNIEIQVLMVFLSGILAYAVDSLIEEFAIERVRTNGRTDSHQNSHKQSHSANKTTTHHIKNSAKEKRILALWNDPEIKQNKSEIARIVAKEFGKCSESYVRKVIKENNKSYEFL